MAESCGAVEWLESQFNKVWAESGFVTEMLYGNGYVMYFSVAYPDNRSRPHMMFEIKTQNGNMGVADNGEPATN